MSLVRLAVADARAHAGWVPVLRLLLSPALIGAASVVARRWGPEAGGWFAALPLTSGPVVLVLALERGPTFAARACAGILLGVVALAAYVPTYTCASRRVGPWTSSALACATYLACLWPLTRLRVSLAVAFAVACVAVAAARRTIPPGASTPIAPARPAWDIPARMGLAAAMVWGLTRLAGFAGPRLSGLLAPFPVTVTILAAFTHQHHGAAAARRLLEALLGGLVSFAVFFFAAGMLLSLSGTPLALSVAAAAAIAVHAAAWRRMRSARTSMPSHRSPSAQHGARR